LEDAAQLVKANSILGSKMNDVDVVYTMWTNLKKTEGMEVGQVGIHKEKEASFNLYIGGQAQIFLYVGSILMIYYHTLLQKYSTKCLEVSVKTF
jgi:hypothetical protein